MTMMVLDIKYSTGEIERYRNTLPMRETWDMYNKEYLHMADSYSLRAAKEIFGENWLNCYAIKKFSTPKMSKLTLKT